MLSSCVFPDAYRVSHDSLLWFFSIMFILFFAVLLLLRAEMNQILCASGHKTGNMKSNLDIHKEHNIMDARDIMCYN